MSLEKVKVLEVAHNVEIEKKDGGTYEATSMLVRKAGSDPRTINISTAYLAINKTLARKLKLIKDGSEITLQMVKEKKDGRTYNNLQAVFLDGEELPEESAVSKASSGNSGKWTPDPEKETRAERQERQLMIVRQSSLERAFDFGITDPDEAIKLMHKFSAAIVKGTLVEALVTTPKQPTQPTVLKKVAKSNDTPFDEVDDDLPVD